MQRLQEYPVNPISGHAYSIDGYNWTFSPIQPYSNAVQRTDGTVQHFATLERPKLLWGDAEDPFREYRAGSSNGHCSCSFLSFQYVVEHAKRPACLSSCV